METNDDYIQLPFGYFENENQDQKIHFNLSHEYKKKLLFDKLPFIAQLNNPAIDNVVKGKENDDLSIQKFLLSTDLLQDTIQNNLEMIVTDGEFNDAGIRQVLDTKFPTIMGKPTATNFMFRDKAKFDIQNPVIGGLYNQLLTKKQKENIELEAIGKAPNIKDIDIRKKLDDLSKFNLGIRGKDDDDDDDDNNNNTPLLPIPPPPSPGPLTSPITPSSTLNQMQRFLLDDGGNERTAVALTTTSTPKNVTFSEAVTKVFPKTRRELLPLENIPEEEEEKNFDVTTESSIDDINLDFFSGGEKNKEKLYQNAIKKVGTLNNSNKKFIEYLSSRFGSFLLLKNKIKIHLESGEIFHDNNLTNESLYEFLYLQQDLSKKELDIMTPVSDDLPVYVRETLTNIVDDDFDLQTNATSKFLFYDFNNLRKHERLPPLSVRHSKIIENEEALKIVQSHNWQYFVETLIHISNNDLSIDSFDLKDDEARDDFQIIEKTQQNLNYCKQFYQEVFEDIAFFLHNKLKEIPDEFIEKIEEDLSNEIFFTRKIKEIESHVEFLKIFSRFYFKTGRFPGNYNDLMVAPPGVKPSFVKSHDEISPVEINEKFHGTSSYGLASVQFIAALHSYFSGNRELSRNVMSEYFQNLSLQALTIDNDNIEIAFDEIIELNRNLKSLIRDDNRNEIRTFDFEFENFPEIKDKNQLIEEEVVSNITNKVTLEHPFDVESNNFPNTPAEIRAQKFENNRTDEKLDAALNERDREISAELVNEARKELIKSVTGEGGEVALDILNNVATTFDLQQENHQEKDVRKHVQETIKKDNEQFIEKKKKSSVKMRVRSPVKTRSSTKKLTDLLKEEERKKPYDKE